MVSIIIVTKNQAGLLKRCIMGLQDTIKDIDFEVLILANNSTKEVRKYLNYIKDKDKRIKVFYSDKDLSFSKANNFLVKQAKGENIVLMNDDIIPSGNWLNSMLKFKDNGIVGAKLINPLNKRIQHAGVCFKEDKKPFHIFYNNEELDPRSCKNQEFQAVTFACVLIKREVWESLNGLEEKEFDKECYYHYEDIDFCLRAREKGYKVWYCAEAVLGHYGAMTSRTKENQNNFKYLEEFKKKWENKIEADYKKYLEFPLMPHILIGIPISEHYKWCLGMLLNNILNIKMYKGCISICFVINNSGISFYRKIVEWAKLYAKEAGFRDVIIPINIFFEGDKNKAVVMSRNIIRKVAREKNATHIFWWDCDVVIPEDTLLKLFKINNRENPITMGTVWYKIPEKKPMLFRKREEVFNKFDDILKEKDEIIEEKTTERESRTMWIGPYRVAFECANGKSRPIEKISAGGLGCCLMRREVADEVEFKPHQKGFGTEDLYYFYQLNKKGYEVLVDTTINTYHLEKGRIYGKV